MPDRNDLSTMLAAAGFVVLPLAVYALRQRQADWPPVSVCGIAMILAAEAVAIRNAFRRDERSSGLPGWMAPFELATTPQGLLFLVGLVLVMLGAR